MESFPHPAVTLIVGIPEYDTLVDRVYHIYFNVTLMQMALGSYKLGFLVLTVSPTVYETFSVFIKILLMSGKIPLIRKDDPCNIQKGQ